MHAKPRKTDRSAPRQAEEAPGGRRGRVPAERPHRTTDAKKRPSRAASGFGASTRPASRSGAGPASRTRVGAGAAPRARPPRKHSVDRNAAPEAPRPMEWNEVRHIKVDANSDGQRIDNFLMKHLPGVPKSAVYRLVRSGQVRVDGGRAKPERKLVAAESVRIPPVRLQDPAEAVRPPDRVLNELRESVIHEDEHYLVINKPEGLSSHGGTGQLYGVIEAIRAWEKYEFIELCHRLDRDTSGVLLLAKNRKALLRAQQAFKNHEITKRYFALVHGRWKGEDRDCDAALVKVRLGDQHHVQLDEEGKPSLSRFSPRSKFKDATLCEVEIFSGRTHQIRVHALALGHPVAGDAKYGERDQNHPMREKGLKRMFLHAHFLQLKQEGDFPKLLLNAPMPDELRNFLQKL
ncbi:MAG: RluA family pseudouridine synthase [Stagnimonas sp.]|nr:RluA family pseudouridine synthase [Stagnimonas sp.]